MSDALRLTISTPMDVLVDVSGVVSLRAEDESGHFGILPGHTDILTALPASVMRWRRTDGVTQFCALRSGVMTVTGGSRVAIACREGILGDDLQALEAEVVRLRAAEEENAREARVEQTRLHASAVRQLIRFLKPERASLLQHPPPIVAGPEPEPGP